MKPSLNKFVDKVLNHLIPFAFFLQLVILTSSFVFGFLDLTVGIKPLQSTYVLKFLVTSVFYLILLPIFMPRIIEWNYQGDKKPNTEEKQHVFGKTFERIVSSLLYLYLIFCGVLFLGVMNDFSDTKPYLSLFNFTNLVLFLFFGMAYVLFMTTVTTYVHLAQEKKQEKLEV